MVAGPKKVLFIAATDFRPTVHARRRIALPAPWASGVVLAHGPHRHRRPQPAPSGGGEIASRTDRCVGRRGTERVVRGRASARPSTGRPPARTGHLVDDRRGTGWFGSAA